MAFVIPLPPSKGDDQIMYSSFPAEMSTSSSAGKIQIKKHHPLQSALHFQPVFLKVVLKQASIPL
ncbi:hypothetical protein EFB08_22560 [Rufibacter latericius]|uniref:Uncharacterized protein n=1 Tax=Rufibacter latericius TaxID=2487040 RepID=A0A3M9M8P1_9BACT|nr:hypothetical protein EFB08_22560 [Rufibacter latericius]